MRDNRVTNNDLLIYTKTQIAISQSVNKIRETLAQFHMHFNDNEYKFLFHGFQNNINVTQKVGRDGISIFSLQEESF